MGFHATIDREALRREEEALRERAIRVVLPRRDEQREAGR